MADLPQRPGSRRPSPFEAQAEPPFWRTPEFTRFAWLALLLIGAGIVAFVMARRAERAATPADAPAAVGAESAAPSLPPPPATATLTDAQRADRDAFLATAFEGALRDQENGQEIAETTGYRKLLEQVAKFSPEEVAQRTQRTLDYPAVLADPDAWRGEFVRLSGLVGDLMPVKLSRPVAGRSDAWRAQFLSGEDWEEGTILEFAERPLPQMRAGELRSRAAQVEGVLYRTVSFEAEVLTPRGDLVSVPRTAPWLFVRNLELIDERPGSSRAFLQDNAIVILALMAFVIFGGRLVAFWIQRRRRGSRRAVQPAGIREMFEQKLREKGHPPAPPPSPKT